MPNGKATFSTWFRFTKAEGEPLRRGRSPSRMRLLGLAVLALAALVAEAKDKPEGDPTVQCADKCDTRQTRCLRTCRGKDCHKRCQDEWSDCQKGCGTPGH